MFYKSGGHVVNTGFKV